jgi:hypothetical protein
VIAVTSANGCRAYKDDVSSLKTKLKGRACRGLFFASGVPENRHCSSFAGMVYWRSRRRTDARRAASEEP